MLVVVDACNLTRNLVLAGELLAYGLPVVVALNMVDLAQRRGLSLDAGAAVARTSAVRSCRSSRGAASGSTGCAPRSASVLPRHAARAERPLRRRRRRMDGDLIEPGPTRRRGQRGRRGGGRVRRRHADRAARQGVHASGARAAACFVGVMVGLFWTLFALATAADGSDRGDVRAARRARGPGDSARASCTISSSKGIIGGIAGTVVFLPQICLLFFLISLLEDTGYLARAAFVMDRLLCRFGLPGHAFVPLLTSHACALPGIMSTRLIPDRRDRFATILVAPFMSCSARLAGLRAADVAAVRRTARCSPVSRLPRCYVLGAVAALLSALLFRRTLLRGGARPMILELPSYKIAVADECARRREGSGPGVSQDRRHGHHGDLHRHVVAERVSARRAPRRRPTPCARRPAAAADPAAGGGAPRAGRRC